jgi:hypothetical protein
MEERKKEYTKESVFSGTLGGLRKKSGASINVYVYVLANQPGPQSRPQREKIPYAHENLQGKQARKEKKRHKRDLNSGHHRERGRPQSEAIGKRGKGGN